MTAARFIPVLMLLAVQGCSTIVSNVTDGLAEDLSAAIINSEDLDVVRNGAPAYLIMLDALLRSDPDNPSLLMAAAELNGAYATAFVRDAGRQQAFADKAYELAQHGACIKLRWTCNARKMDFDVLERDVAKLDVKRVPTAYSFATAWAGWIQAHRDDWAAIAELGRVKAIMQRVADLDEGYEHGGPRLYLGVFETLLPPALGGRPELGREQFEKAIAISHGRSLMAKVLLAEQYARLVFDRELHDRELNEVLEANPVVDGLTLMNLIAQEQARELLATSDEYF